MICGMPVCVIWESGGSLQDSIPVFCRRLFNVLFGKLLLPLQTAKGPWHGPASDLLLTIRSALVRYELSPRTTSEVRWLAHEQRLVRIHQSVEWNLRMSPASSSMRSGKGSRVVRSRFHMIRRNGFQQLCCCRERAVREEHASIK
jgi:hypothetical protein